MTLFCIKETRSHSLCVKLELNNTLVPFEVDTGVAISIMPDSSFKQYLPYVKLNSTETRLQTYTAEPMKVLRETIVQVKYSEYKGTLKLYVVEATGPNLMGLNWLQQIPLDWKSLGVTTIQSRSQTLPEILNVHKDAFQEELGMMKDFTAKLFINSNAKLKFFHPRSIPVSLKDVHS